MKERPDYFTGLNSTRVGHGNEVEKIKTLYFLKNYLKYKLAITFENIIN